MCVIVSLSVDLMSATEESQTRKFHRKSFAFGQKVRSQDDISYFITVDPSFLGINSAMGLKFTNLSSTNGKPGEESVSYYFFILQMRYPASPGSTRSYLRQPVLGWPAVLAFDLLFHQTHVRHMIRINNAAVIIQIVRRQYVFLPGLTCHLNYPFR